MAMYQETEEYLDGNAARQLKEKNKVVRLTDKQLRSARRKNTNYLTLTRNLAVVALILCLSTYMVYGQVQLSELNDQVSSATTELEQLQSVGIQLEMKAQSDMNIDEIEEYVTSELNMRKVNSEEITYVNVGKDDVGEIVVSDGEGIDGLLDGIWKALVSLVS